jgi:hypothetical protein
MAKAQTVLISLVTILIFLVVYKFLFNPQVVMGNLGTICPDRWVYMSGKCIPTYGTTCTEFDPNTIKSDAQACNLARSCGTSWSGKCA